MKQVLKTESQLEQTHHVIVAIKQLQADLLDCDEVDSNNAKTFLSKLDAILAASAPEAILRAPEDILNEARKRSNSGILEC